MNCAGGRGVNPHSCYAWTKEVMDAGKQRLSRDTVRDATRQEIQELKQLVVELSLQAHHLKETAIPMPWDAARING